MRILPRSFRFLAAVALLSLVPVLHAGDAEDKATIAEMTRQTTELQRRILDSRSPDEQVRLQKQVMQVMEATLPKLTPKNRAMLSVGLKLVTPLMQDSSAYMMEAAAFFQSPAGNPATASSVEDLRARIAKLKSLGATNNALLGRMTTIEEDATHMLHDGGVSQSDTEGFMAGFRQSTGNKIGASRAIRTLEGELYTQLVRLTELQVAQWGHWTTKPDGTIGWQDKAAETEAAAINEAIRTVAERQAKAQQVLRSRI